MTSAEVAKVLGDILINLSLVGVLVFVLSYGVFFRWTSTGAGRSIMAFATSLVALSGVSFAVRLLERTPAVEWFRTGAMLFVFLACWGMVIVLWRTRNRDMHAAPVKPRQPGRLRTWLRKIRGTDPTETKD